MGNIFKIRGNQDMLCVSQERMVKVVGVIIQNGRPPAILLWFGNIQHNCLKKCLIVQLC